MQFDLMKAFVFTATRRGEGFPLSTSTAAYINERIDKQRQRLVGQTAATGQGQVEGGFSANEHGEPNGTMVGG